MSNISKITYTNDMTLVTLGALPGDSQSVAEVLTAFAEANVNVDMISQTAPLCGATRLSFTISDDSLANALSILSQVRTQHNNITPEILPGNSKIAFYDENMVRTPGVAAKVFSLLAGAGVQVILITTSDVDISILVPAYMVSEALTALSAAFGVSAEETTF